MTSLWQENQPTAPDPRSMPVLPPQNPFQQTPPQQSREFNPQAPEPPQRTPHVRSNPVQGSLNGLDQRSASRQPNANPTPHDSILPPLTSLPAIPDPRRSGPILFEGRIEEATGDEAVARFPSLPQLQQIVPLPQPDPSLLDAGNGDGQLDWVDVIEEYGGRATRSDIPPYPEETPPENRSWFRMDHFRADAWWLNGEGNDLGWFSGYGSVTLGLAKIQGVTITPAVAFHGLNGANQSNISSTLYDGEIEAAWMHRYHERLRMRTALKVGVYSDLKDSDYVDALRPSGSFIMSYEKNPEWQFVLGAALYNIETQKALPIVGFVYQPSDVERYEIVFPEWKLSGKVKTGREYVRWAYITGSFWGRTWRTERTTGTFDEVTYSDWRIAAGWESKHLSGITSFVEFGYAFQREISFESGVGDYDPSGQIMARGGFYF